MQPIMFLDDKDTSKAESGPGPGSYELQYFQSIKTKMETEKIRPSPCFQQCDYVDRFGRTMSKDAAQPAAPAGHSHGGGARIPGPQKGVAAPFKSQSAGHEEYDLKEAMKAPGPAYYSPALPTKQSFHLNARKRFMKQI